MFQNTIICPFIVGTKILFSLAFCIIFYYVYPLILYLLLYSFCSLLISSLSYLLLLNVFCFVSFWPFSVSFIFSLLGLLVSINNGWMLVAAWPLQMSSVAIIHRKYANVWSLWDTATDLCCGITVRCTPFKIINAIPLFSIASYSCNNWSVQQSVTSLLWTYGRWWETWHPWQKSCNWSILDL